MRSETPVMGERSTNLFPDISQDWLLWCRLCAKSDIQNINIFLKNEDMITSSDTIDRNGLTVAISKHFNVEMTPEELLPIQLCTDCFLLITSLLKFNERVIKVQQMYLALRHSHRNGLPDLPALRLKYGVLEYEQPHQFMYRSVAEVQLFGEKLNTHEEQKRYPTDVEITLQQQHIGIEVKRENSNDTSLTDEDVCDFANEDAEGEDPFGSDLEYNNEDDTLLHAIAKKSSKQIKEGIEVENEMISKGSSIKNITSIRQNKTKIHYGSKKRNLLENVTSNKLGASKEVEGDEKDKSYTCTECSKVFKRLSNYRLHMERKHSKADAVPSFICAECSATFNTSTQLKHHHSIKHLPLAERRTIPCAYCEQKFPTKQYVATHIKFVHMNERSFICEECGEAVRSKAQLKQHMLTHTDHAPFECKVCKKCFKNQERLKNHMETHNPNKHICAECGLQLNSRITLNRHLLVHSDVMQHKCDYCGRAFKRAKALKNHLILHTGLKPYSCDFCDRTFANGSNCRTHKRKAHPEELAAQEAAGEKSYTKNIPKLAVLKSVTQAAENLAPVVSKQSGNFAFGIKPKLPLDSVGTISKKQRKLYNESILNSTSTTSDEPMENSHNNKSNQPLLHPTNIQSNRKNENDNIITNQNVPIIDNIYNHLTKQTARFGMAPASEISPLHLDVKRSRSEVSTPTGNNSCIDIDITNAITQQQHQLSQQVISSPQQQTTSEVQSFYRC